MSLACEQAFSQLPFPCYFFSPNREPVHRLDVLVYFFSRKPYYVHKKFVAINLSFISAEKYISYGDISFRMRGLICHGDLVRNISKKEVMYISVVS